jgi:hypothetical protein
VGAGGAAQRIIHDTTLRPEPGGAQVYSPLVDPAWAAKVRENRMQDLLPFTPEAMKSLS